MNLIKCIPAVQGYRFPFLVPAGIIGPIYRAEQVSGRKREISGAGFWVQGSEHEGKFYSSTRERRLIAF